jgi:formylglycine-generating enzyme required for sulfatase activity
MTPSKIGRYRLDHAIDQGGIAPVYCAYDPASGRRVAIKLFPAELLDDPDFMGRFNQVVQAILGFDGGIFVPVLDWGRSNGRPYIVMQCMENGTLEDRLREKQLSIKEAAALIARLGPPLEQAYAQGIIHNHILPHHILFDSEDVPYVTAAAMTRLIERVPVSPARGAARATPAAEPASAEGSIEIKPEINSFKAALFQMFSGRLASDPGVPAWQAKAVAAGEDSGFDQGFVSSGNRFAFLRSLRHPRLLIAGIMLVLVSAAIAAVWLGSRRVPASAGSLPSLAPSRTSGVATQTLPALALPATSTPFQAAAAAATDPPATAIPAAATLVPEPSRSPTHLPSATPTPVPLPGAVQISAIDGMPLVYVPAGDFTMGSNAAGGSNEDPEHLVTLPGFWIDQTEVTNAMYALCVQAGACAAPSNLSSAARNSYFNNPDYAHYPVIFVDWDSAVAYCSWAGRRLPSEAMWEKAARGPDARLYPWGNELDPARLNAAFESGDTTPAGAYPAGASPYGALDMSGNVWEWVADWYGEDYYSLSPAGSPPGPESGEMRVRRGGSWDSGYAYVHTTGRGYFHPAIRGSGIGFRCALTR